MVSAGDRFMMSCLTFIERPPSEPANTEIFRTASFDIKIMDSRYRAEREILRRVIRRVLALPPVAVLSC